MSAGRLTPGRNSPVCIETKRPGLRRAPGGPAGSLRAREGAATVAERSALGVVYSVPELDGVGGPNDQSIAHAVERLEHEERPHALIGELHLLGEGGSGACQARALAIDVAYPVAGSIDREHVSMCHAVACSTVDRNHLILTDEHRAIDYSNDPAIHVTARCGGHEVQGDVSIDRHHLVT